jgi:hypothetical protein
LGDSAAPGDTVAQIVPEGDTELAAGLLQAGEAVATAFAQITAGTAADPAPLLVAAQHKLAAMAGIKSVRINPRAGSITIHYDADALKRTDLLAALEEVGCMSGRVRSDEGMRKLADTFGKALVGAVMHKAVEQSARTLVAAVI